MQGKENSRRLVKKVILLGQALFSLQIEEDWCFSYSFILHIFQVIKTLVAPESSYVVFNMMDT